MTDKIETRTVLSPVESSSPDGMHFSGYALKFNDPGLVDKPGQRSKFFEQIAPGAAKYKGAISLYQHDPTKLLGTVENGTLKITEDRTGIRDDIDLPDTTYGRDVAELVKRGDIRGQSFSFKVNAGGQKWEQRSDGIPLRTLTDIDIIEFGPTVLPVYDGTTAMVRSAYGHDAEVDVPETRSTFSMPQHVGAANEALLAAERIYSASPEQATGLLLASHNSLQAARVQYLDPDTASALGIDVKAINTRLDTASKALESAATAATSAQDMGPHVDAAKAAMGELSGQFVTGSTAQAMPTTPSTMMAGRSNLRLRHDSKGMMIGMREGTN